MKRLFRAAVVSSLFVSSMALAQDMNVNMNVQVDDDSAPNANINIQAGDGMGGAHMQVNVRGGAVQTHTRETVIIHDGAVQVNAPPPPPQQQAYRDCGTGNDPGCGMMRDGKYPMDAETWRGFYKSLKTQSNEITREEMASKMLKRMYITAAQMGLVLDLFPNEITRLDVAKVAATHVVNPQHALGFSSKWDNSISAGEYTDLIAEQQP